MSGPTADALREAGAILPGKPGRSRSVDTITARAYAHPALEHRVVVRLVPGALGEAEDLSMEFLGFAAAAKPVPVGHGQRQALGFPAWALVNDPANGRHALALVKDMERLARVAKTKPGNARDGYDELAVRLGGAAPHFLPTFWEQAGRAFLAGENPKMASSCFVAARLAEQVHSLEVDEDRLREVYLEFAFAGALTAKALADYAREVTQRRPAPEAYELVRTIAVRRVAGGLPPYVGMADDLKRLAKAAGLKPDAEAEAVIGELLGYPAVVRASAGFWKAYRAALVRLAQRDAEFQARLLTLWPDPPSSGGLSDSTEFWLEVLADAGATAIFDGVDQRNTLRSGCSSDVAGWVQRVLDYRGGGWHQRPRSPRWLAVLTELAPTVGRELAARDAVLRVCPDRVWLTDADALDICLAAGIAVADPRYNTSRNLLDLSHWVAGPDTGRRDLAAVSADERFRSLLVGGLTSLLNVTSGERSRIHRQAASAASLRHLDAAGLRAALHSWLTGLSRQVGETPTVLALSEAIDSVAMLWSPEGAALLPQPLRELAEVDIRDTLARSLRGGFPAELVWPAYERARSELSTPDTMESWPALILSDRTRAIAIGPDDVLFDHHFRFPKDAQPSTWETPHASYVDGQLQVRWSGGSYWSGRPDEVAAFEGWDRARPDLVSFALAGGGRTTGARPWRIGDIVPPERHHIVSDGVSYWRAEAVGDPQVHPRQWQWREYDPQTGAAGRVSQPAFFDRPLADGDQVQTFQCYLRPAPDGMAGSPVGWRDGLVGWYVVRHKDGSYSGTGIDGRTVTWWPEGDRQSQLSGALRLPGDERPRPATSGGSYGYRGQPHMTLWDVDGRHPLVRPNLGPSLPPPTFWSALRPRDEAGSLALRAADAALAGRLLDASADASGQASSRDSTLAAVGAVLPEITDAFLAATVAESVAQAEQVRRLQVELAVLLSAQPLPARADEAVTTIDEPALRSVLWDFAGDQRNGWYRHEPPSTLTQIQAVASILAGTARPGTVVHGDASWQNALPWLGAILVRASSPVTSDAQRLALFGLVRQWHCLALAGAGQRVRLLRVNRSDGANFEDTERVHQSGRSTIVLTTVWIEHDTVPVWVGQGLEFSPTGEFSLPATWNLRSETTVTGWGDPDRLAAAAALLEQHGPAPWRADAVDRLVGLTGMAHAEAALLLAGLPGLSTGESNFLTGAQRTLLGVKMNEAKVARDGFQRMARGDRLNLLEAAMPDEAADLWTQGPDVLALAKRWTELVGTTVQIPADLITEADRLLPYQNVSSMLRTIAAPQLGDWLHTDGVGHRAHTRTQMKSDHGEPFDDGQLRDVAVLLPWLAYRLPAGDPIRTQLPAVYRLIRERLRNPELLVGLHYDDSVAPDDIRGLVRVRYQPGMEYYEVRPADLADENEPALSFIDPHTAASLRLLLSDRFAMAMASIVDESLPVGRYAQDPTGSVPDLVETVAATYGLSSDAAAYYLQLLALPDPTDKRVAEWNGWRPPALRAARTALAATDLVVEAKRERAGRTLFLPGGWIPVKAPELPIESWKQGLGIGVGGGLPRGRILVPMTVPELFRSAWHRVTTGDTPRYLSLSETR